MGEGLGGQTEKLCNLDCVEELVCLLEPVKNAMCTGQKFDCCTFIQHALCTSKV